VLKIIVVKEDTSFPFEKYSIKYFLDKRFIIFKILKTDLKLKLCPLKWFLFEIFEIPGYFTYTFRLQF